MLLNFGRDINDSGLGIGTTAKSFHNSGINVSIVEIDPIIHSFAQRYFGLPQVKGQVAFADGRRFIEDAARHGEKWDFVVHDVFTGGKVPERLFTREMWKATKEVLKENGVLAVVGFLYPLGPPPFCSYSMLPSILPFCACLLVLASILGLLSLGFPSFPLSLLAFCLDI